MVRLRSGNAPTPAKTAATGRPILREKTNTTTGTPAPAVETSMLALKNFKRRPRQGSMLEMVRKRRSSVQASLISARPQQDDDVEDTSVFDLGSASEGEDVFAPEAEGTPLQTSKTRKSTSTRKSVSARKSVAATTPAVKRTKRKSDDLESPHSALDALRAKHRKSEAPPVEDEPLPSIDDDEQEPIVHDTSDHEASPMPNQVTSDVQVINSSPKSTPPTEPSSTRKIPGTEEADFAVPSTEEQERLHTLQQDALEDEPEEEVEAEDEAAEDEDDLDTPNTTMAEPASSSPNGSPIPDTQRTDIYADPLTQLSPPPPEPAKTRSKGNNKKPTAMSTATLRALLPRRTQRPQSRPKRTEYDISSDEEDDATAFDTTHLEEDEDELGGRIRRQTKAPVPSKGKAATAKSKSKSKSTTSTRKPSAPPPPAKNKSKSKTKAKTTTRTYGRGATTTSDKENEESSSDNDEQAETSMSMREVTHSKELEEARRKFAEVDNWDLTFESMSNEDHRSSSQGWR
jgi:hypothetical protein